VFERYLALFHFAEGFIGTAEGVIVCASLIVRQGSASGLSQATEFASIALAALMFHGGYRDGYAFDEKR
jgi:hypothetical protein